MDALTAVGTTLDRAVDEGRLIGYVCGVREGGRSRVAAGGSRVIDGVEMTAETVFPLSSNTKPLGGVLAMALVERGVLDMDAPVDRYLPELATPRVLARPDAPLDETVPADRPLTLRHLLTMTAGFGWAGESQALAEAMAERKIAPGPYSPPVDPDTYLHRLSGLPLAGQPGEGWWYHTSSDVLGILLARATGSDVAALMAEYVMGPLGLENTGFAADPARLPTSYGAGSDGRPEALETASWFAGPPVFDSLACGLVSTVGDYLEFLDVLVDGGPVLSPDSVRLLTKDHLTDRQRESAQDFLEPGAGYGLQVEVRPGGVVGWTGGLGTIGYADRGSGRSAAVFTTQSFEVPGTEEALGQVWRLLAG